MLNLGPALNVMQNALGRVFPAAQLEIRLHGQVVHSEAYGWLDPEERTRPTRLDTLFDLASVTKLFVTTAFMTLVEEGAVGIDQPVRTVLPEFDGPRPIKPYDDPLKPGAFVEVVPPTGQIVNAGQITFRHLLAHNSGLPAWRPLYKQGSPQAAQHLALHTDFAYPPGTHSIYSDIGLILLGMSVEKLSGLRLDEAVRARVTGPGGMAHTDYRPVPPAGHTTGAPDNIAPTEQCAWRGRRIVGEVHDENAYGLGGIAGHAGLFSTVPDTAALGQLYLDSAAGRAGPLRLRPETVAEMTRLQAEDGMTRRGLGFALWCPDPEASGNAFSPRAYGHTGFTGPCLWIDPERDLVVASMTNRVYYGREVSGIIGFRAALHRAIVEAVDKV